MLITVYYIFFVINVFLSYFLIEAIRIFNKIKNVKNLSHVKVHTPTDIYPTAKDIIGQANSRQDSLLSENGLTKISSNSSDSGITTIQPNKRPFGQSLNSNSQVCNADTYDDDLQSDISDIEFSHIKLLVQAYNVR